MSLLTLLKEGAEATAVAYLRSIPWTTTASGQPTRRGLRESDYQKMFNALRKGREPLTGAERSEFRRIIDAADQATRNARKIAVGASRQPKPSDIERLPGTGNRGGSIYTYTVVVSTIDPDTGQANNFTAILESRQLLDMDSIRSQMMEKLSTGDFLSRQGTDPQKLGRRIVQDIALISVYQGVTDL